MINLIKIFAARIGLDNAILWSILNKGFGIIKGPLNVYIILNFLDLNQQGYWYTFTNLSAITILADLGFASIITQFVSHEYAHIKIIRGDFFGEKININRFFSLIKFAITVYIFVSIFAVAVLLISGWVIFHDVKSANLFLAWFLYTIISSFGLFLSLFQAIYQGLDKVKIVQQNALIYSIVSTLLTWIFLLMKFEIWSLIWGTLISVPIAFYILVRENPIFWRKVYDFKLEKSHSFVKELMPLQFRYSISFISSYLISYLYVPTIFRSVGSESAAKFGISLAIINVISSVSINWLISKTPKMNILVAQRKVDELDLIFKYSLRNSLFIYLLLSILFIMFMSSLQWFSLSFYERFLDIPSTIMLLVTSMLSMLTTGFASYLRAFKQEPLVYFNLFTGIVTACLLYFFMIYTVDLAGFLRANLIFNTLIACPIAVVLFIRFRKKFLINII